MFKVLGKLYLVAMLVFLDSNERWKIRRNITDEINVTIAWKYISQFL
jgi:hypothetical protein